MSQSMIAITKNEIKLRTAAIRKIRAEFFKKLEVLRKKHNAEISELNNEMAKHKIMEIKKAIKRL